MVAFAKYKERPFVVNATIIIKGIKINNDLSFSINSFFIAGSNSQAIEDVLPATKTEKIAEIIILSKYFFE